MEQELIISRDLEKDIESVVARQAFDRLFVLTDTTTLRLCWPMVETLPCLASARMITIGESDENKTLDSVVHVWTALQQGDATRHSLLSQVDASVGGKTGINFGGLKNEIGIFNCAASVILSSRFLCSLDHRNLLSGYAEMLKHGLISNGEIWAELLRFDLAAPDYDGLGTLVAKSVAVKQRIVEQDPTEKGLRKALNLGHTAGHALESLALESGRPVLHGYAVAWGLICELYLSTVKCGFPKDRMRQTVQFIRQHYGEPGIDCKHYERLYDFMKHDKKNEAGVINFTLLADIGAIRINRQATREEVFEMLDFLREG